LKTSAKDPSLHKAFSYQPCTKISPKQEPRCAHSTYICEEDVSLHKSFGAGYRLAFKPNTKEDPDGIAGGFTLVYDLGESQGCPKGRTSFVRFTCQIGATPYSRFELDEQEHLVDASRCEYHFLVTTESACPACTPDDVTRIESHCTGGERKVTYTLKIPCLNPPPETTEPCSGVEVNQLVILIVSGSAVGAMLVLIGVTVYFWRKKNQVAHQYKLLMQDQDRPAAEEMQEIGEKDESEEDKPQGDDEPSTEK